MSQENEILAAAAVENQVTGNLDDNSGGTLREIVANAETGDTITFASSVDKVTLAGVIDTGDKKLTIDGSRENEANVIIDGGNATQLLTSSDTITLKDLTLQNGNSTYDRAGAVRGNVWQLNGQVVFDNNISGNSSSSTGGGAIYAKRVIMTGGGNYTFRNNSTNKNGGALFLLGGASTITNTLFDKNGIKTTDTVTVKTTDGGAVYVKQSPLDIGRANSDGETTFSGNISTNGGGAVFIVGKESANASVTIYEKTTFDSNESKMGGAVYVGGGTVRSIYMQKPYSGITKPYVMALPFTSLTVQVQAIFQMPHL